MHYSIISLYLTLRRSKNNFVELFHLQISLGKISSLTQMTFLSITDFFRLAAFQIPSNIQINYYSEISEPNSRSFEINV